MIESLKRILSWQLFLVLAVPVSFGLLSTADTLSGKGLRTNKILLFRATPYEVRPGDLIMLEGSGFSKISNRVYFNGGSEVVATSSSGITLNFRVPNDLSEGEYQLSVANSLGLSNSDNSGIKISLKVTSTPISGPTIIKAVFSGGIVNVTGSGFTTSNDLITTFGNLSGLSSPDGSTLTFRLSDLSLYSQIKQSLNNRKSQASLWIFVQNEHGSNKNPYKLDVII